MINKLIVFFLLCFSIQIFGQITVSNDIFVSDSRAIRNYPKEISNAVDLVHQLKEVQDLIGAVQKKGPIKITLEDMGDESFEAFWNGSERTIKINRTSNQNLGHLISSIVFELHNALSNSRLIDLTDLAIEGKLSKEQYVVGIEKMEHFNALQTSLLLEKGISLGLFPKSATWPIFRSFEDHYYVQQIQGHSEWIANHYNILNPQGINQTYNGTIPNLANFTEKDKVDFQNFLWIKNELDNPMEEMQRRGMIALNDEFSKIEGCFTGKILSDCSRASKKADFMDIIFSGNTFYERLKLKSPVYANR